MAVKLKPKQAQFVAEYLVDLNGTQAAIRAGYSPKTANEQAARLLANVSVSHAISLARASQLERTEISADLVLKRLLAIATCDVNEIVELRRVSCPNCHPHEEGKARPKEVNPECVLCQGEGLTEPFFKDTRTLSPAARALYAGVKVTNNGLEVKLNSQEKALELLGDHLGLFVKRLEHTGRNGMPIETVTVNLTPEQLREAVLSVRQKY